MKSFAILECADLDEAMEIASRNPMAYEGRLELRPIHSMGGPTTEPISASSVTEERRKVRR